MAKKTGEKTQAKDKKKKDDAAGVTAKPRGTKPAATANPGAGKKKKNS